MKKIIYSLVIMIAAGSLFTSCLEYVEPVGIQQLRAAKADYLDALAQLRLADAELQKANAAYVLAQAAYVDAQTEWQLIENRIHEYDVQIKAAQTDYEVDSLKKEKELLQITHAEKMADAKAALANAEENLRVTLRDIAAVQHLLTVHERFIFNGVLAAYEEAFDAYNDKLMDLEKAKAKLWSLEYGFKDSIDWEADYQGNIDFFTAEIARAQVALEAVPENLDLEAWNAEVENLKDSIDAYNYGRQAISKDSVLYMTSVYCEGSEAYERAFEAWLEANKVEVDSTSIKLKAGVVPYEKGFDGKDLKIEPVAPAKPDFSGKAARLNWEFTGDTNDPAAALVYNKFVDLITDYRQDAPFGKDSTVANGGYYGNVFAGGGIDTLKINATVDMKDFILNDSTPQTKSYKWKRSDGTEVNSVGKYGLRGAIDILERELVLIDAASNVPAKQNAYNNARNRWLADREYLINKTHLAEEAAALANMKTSVLITSPGEHDGRAEDLIYAIKDFKQSRTDFGKNSSYADTIQLINAIKDFFNAKAAYIGQAFKGYDSITFKNTMGEDTKVFLGDLEYAPFVQKETKSDSLYSSIYGGKNYKTESGELNKAVDSTFASGNEFEYDAILKVLKAIFPFEETNLNTWNDAENWIDNNMGTDDLAWKVYSATGVIEEDAQKLPDTYDKTKADLNLKGKGTTEFLKVYNRFWGTAAVDMATAIYKDDAGCYTEATFKDPYKLVRFTGAQINFNTDLAVVLSLIDPYGKRVDGNYKLTHNWDQAAINSKSAIFGDVTGGKPSEFYKMLKAEQDLIIEMAMTTYSATLAEIKAYVAQIEADFDAKRADMQNKYNAAKEAYDFNKAAWATYQANLKAKKEALLLELTGNKEGKVVPAIAKPDTNTHNVPTCMTKYLDHEGLNVYNGAYKLGGKQLAWANEFLPDYPAKLKEWMIATRTANHVIGHLNTLINVLDSAYRAATGIYQYEWEKYVLTVDPVTHEYEVDVDAIRRNYDAAGAATLLKYFDNYNRFQRQYVRAWEKYLEDCTAELGFWKKVLAAYNAGYDPLEMAIKEQKNVVEQLEKEVEIAKKKLELAEAEYKETLAKLLN
jgi:predicted  nucleic acid-binding Zn-ribbon protein